MTNYKPLDEKHGPQPRLPEGYGVTHLVVDDIEEYWHPVRLVSDATTMVNYEYFRDSYYGGPLSYHSRRQAIRYIYRWYRRYGDLGLSLPPNVGPCFVGIPSNLYQHERVTIADAAQRLGLKVKDVHKIRKSVDLKAILVHGKERSKGHNYFHNYYTINLAYLEAFLDVHGYPPHYPGQTAASKETALSPVVWNV